jgi:hypothetical protein
LAHSTLIEQSKALIPNSKFPREVMVRRVTDVDAKMAAAIGRHFCHNLLKPARNPGTERCSTDLEKGIQISAEIFHREYGATRRILR